jgi:hypothetical protein
VKDRRNHVPSEGLSQSFKGKPVRKMALSDLLRPERPHRVIDADRVAADEDFASENDRMEKHNGEDSQDQQSQNPLLPRGIHSPEDAPGAQAHPILDAARRFLEFVAGQIQHGAPGSAALGPGNDR